MNIRSRFTQGIFALILCALPFWYFMTSIYPTIQDNYVYLGAVGLILVVFAGLGARFAAGRR